MPNLNRRTFLTTAAAGTAAASLTPRTAFAKNYTNAPSVKPNTVATKDTAVVETECGKVRGFTQSGTYLFRNIPYGATTAGPNRFLPAKKPEAWTGVKPTMAYGPVCPQVARAGWHNNEEAWLMDWDDGFPGEDCLSLNIWTPAINDNKKRTVMFWIHGGGYSAGSSRELPSYDGMRLTQRGDVVVVSVNHRLNLLGFLNLAPYGDQFKQSANVGMTDIVLALEWVKTNISNFGGDPNSVMIFGQSGGGGKVSFLMGMPSAQGLYHRAIIESGSQPRNYTLDDSAKVSAALLKELNVTNATDLQTISYDKLLTAATNALRTLNPPPRQGGLRQSGGATYGWNPVIDGQVIPETPFYPKAPDISAKIPILIGSTLNEFVSATDHPEFLDLTEAELLKRVEVALPGKAEEAIAIYRRADPHAIPFEIWSRMNATTAMRRNAVEQAKRKAEQGTGAYLYQFRWRTPVLDGRPGAFHCSEIAFAFDNTDRCNTSTGGGEDARTLAANVSDCWLQFAKTGNPNHKGMPQWDSVTKDKVPTLLIDNKCELKNDFDKDELRITNS